MSLSDLTLSHLQVFANPKSDNKQVQAAEGALAALGEQPGYAGVLLHLLAQTTPAPLPKQLRLLAVTTLHRSVIKPHWVNDGHDKHALSEADKAEVRAKLPLFLADQDAKVRATAAVALGSVAREDWPGAWPEFLDGLVLCFKYVIDAESSASSVVKAAASPQDWLRAEGALVCLEHFIGEADTRHMPLLAASLNPFILGLATLAGASPGSVPGTVSPSSAFGLWIRTRALAILRSLVEGLGTAKDAGKECKSQVKAVLDRDFNAILAAIASALTQQGWGGRPCLLKQAALRLITMLAQYFPARIKPSIAGLMAGVVTVAGQAAQAFARGELDVPAEDEEDEAVAEARRKDGVVAGSLDVYCSEAEDEDSTPPSTVIVGILSVLQGALCSMERAISDAASAVAHSPAIAALLLTAAQLPTGVLSVWGDEPDAFLRDESEDVESGCSMRQDVRDAALDFADVAGLEALQALLAACVQGLGGHLPSWQAMAGAAAAAGGGGASFPQTLALSPRRWKVVEACIYLVGCLRRYLNDPRKVSALVCRNLPKVSPADKAGKKGSKKSKKEKGEGDEESGKEWQTVAEAVKANPSFNASLPLNPSEFANKLIALIQDGGMGAFDPASDSASYRSTFSPYVLGRCLWCASGLSPALETAQAQALLNVATEGLQPSHSLPIRVAACKALVRLLKRVPTEAVEASAPAILTRLKAAITEAISEATSKASAAKPEAVAAGGVDVNDTAIILLELLVYTCTYAPKATASFESELTSLLLHLWVRKGSHPELFSIISSGLQTLIFNESDAAATSSMMSQLPTLLSVLNCANIFAPVEDRGGSTSASAVATSPTAAAAIAADDTAVLAAVVLPGGGESLPFTKAAVKSGALPLPSSLAEAGLNILTTMLRRARDLLPPAPADSTAGHGPVPLSLQALVASGRADAASASTPRRPGAYVLLPPQLNAALAAACKLLAVTADHKVMTSGAETLAVAVRLAGPSLLAPPAPAAGGSAAAPEESLSPSLFLAVPARLLSTAREQVAAHSADTSKTETTLIISDDVAGHVAPLITALLSHARFDGLVEGVVPALLHRLAQARLPSTVQRFVHALSHAVIVGGADVVAPIMASCTVVLPLAGQLAAHADAATQTEADALAKQATELAAQPGGAGGFTQSGLQLFARACVKYFPYIEAPISKHIITAACVALLRLPAVIEVLSAISVPGEREATEAATGSSIASRTRNQKKTAVAAAGGVRHIPVPLSVKLLTLVIREWHMLVTDEDEGEAGSDDSDDEDGDEDEDGGHGGRYTRGRAKGTRYADADEAAALYGLGDDDDDDDEDGESMGKDAVLLADLLGGGDGMGLGKGSTLAALMKMAALQEEADDDGDNGDEDGDNADGIADRFRREFDDEEVAQIACWDEIEDADDVDQGSVVAAGRKQLVPPHHDPVVAMFVKQPKEAKAERAARKAAEAVAAATGGSTGSKGKGKDDEEGDEDDDDDASASTSSSYYEMPHVSPHTDHITRFLAGLAAEAARAPGSAAASIVAATTQELNGEERKALAEKLAAIAAGAGGS